MKFIIISFLVLYILFKLGGFFFRVFLRAAGAKMMQNGNGTFYSKTYTYGGTKTNYATQDVHVDYVPENASGKTKKGSTKGFTGGEYVEYEEVK